MTKLLTDFLLELEPSIREILTKAIEIEKEHIAYSKNSAEKEIKEVIEKIAESMAN